MGSLVAVVSRKRKNVFDRVATMLEALKHRGSDAFGIASSSCLVSGSTLTNIREAAFNSPSLIGHGLARNSSTKTSQPVRTRDFTLVFEGQVFPIPQEGSVNLIKEELRNIEGIKNKAVHVIQRFSGAYTFAIAENNKIVAGRDPLGVYPLYIGESKDYYAIATEQKALWAIGITEMRPFLPGHLALINKKRFSFETGRTLTQPPMQELGMEAAARQLKNLLLRATEDYTSDIRDVAIAFSGGLDSSVVASLAALCNLEVHLIYVTLEGQEETAFAEQAADSLSLPLRLVEYSLEDIIEILPKIVWLIEESSAVNVAIALPMFWIAEQASKHGFRFLASGQGADELFGGYHRYLQDYTKHGLAGLRKKLVSDVKLSADTNFPRDNKVCAYHKVELRMPFAEWNVTRFSLGLPAKLKVASQIDTLRKRVLRKMAEDLGLPKKITEKAKKAIQYTTGVNQAIRKIAKSEGLSFREYVQAIFLKELERTR